MQHAPVLQHAAMVRGQVAVGTHHPQPHGILKSSSGAETVGQRLGTWLAAVSVMTLLWLLRA
jgi:hypothetical protein